MGNRICALPGCGRKVTKDQEDRWKYRREKNPRLAGPFCSKECYYDHRKNREITWPGTRNS